MTVTIKTVETDPDHHVIGHLFKHFGEGNYYIVTKWISNDGYEIEPWVVWAGEKRTVSTHIVGRTLHHAHNLCSKCVKP